MIYEMIDYREDDAMALVTLNRPDVLNALNRQMRAEILDAARRAQKNCRAMVFTGAGTAFCSGQDLGGEGSFDKLNLERTLRDEYEPMIRAIVCSEIPTIAAVNGPAVGAGANLALAADVVIASEAAYFMQAFTRIGLMPDAGGTFMLPRQIGHARAMGMMLFADRIDARDASASGMIYESIPHADFDAHWRARAAQLASGPTVAYKGVKQALRASQSNSMDEQLQLEAKLQGACGKTRDFREGVLAFLEKRPGAFEGR